MRRTRRTRRLTRKSTKPRRMVEITRYYMIGCPACEMSKKPWDEFRSSKQARGVKVLEVESANIPDEAKIEAFPTYVVRRGGKETSRKQGAIMSAGEINQLL